MLNFDQIKELIELVGEHGLAGVELERSGFRLKVDGKEAAPAAITVAPAAAAPPVALAAAAAPQAAAPPASSESASQEASTEGVSPKVPDGAHSLTSPIVGTFYRAPNPGAPAFVEVGGRVKKGQVVCIIEAMKLMNEIEADVDGVVVEVYPENAQPVEFGEPLFAIQS